MILFFFKVYLEGEFPAGFKRLRNETREMLDEFRAYSDNIQYEFIDPSDIETEEGRNNLYRELVKKGLQPTDLRVKKDGGSSQQLIFPGALVVHKGRELPIQLLSTQIGLAPEAQLNNSIQDIEYKFTNVIKKLGTGLKQKIAFIEGHGELPPVEVADITKALSEFYDVERVTINGKLNSIAQRRNNDTSSSEFVNKFDALIIAKPDTTFSKWDKYIIDQFIVRGGKVLWLVDPVFASMDSLQKSDQSVAIANNLDLQDMFFKYGVRLNTDLIMDLNALPIPIVTGSVGNQPRQEFLPWYFFPILTPVSKHPITNNLNAIKTEFISSIDTVGGQGIKKTVLLTSSQRSRTINTPALVSLEILRVEPRSQDFNKSFVPVAVLLEGEFESAFRNRLKPEFIENRDFDFREKAMASRMVIVTDGDLIKNQLHYSQGYPLPLGYDQYTRQNFGNKDFIMNAMNYLLDDSGLISVRSREIKLRLLDKTRIKESKLFWQLINTVLPILIIIVFGFVRGYIRKRKYTHTT